MKQFKPGDKLLCIGTGRYCYEPPIIGNIYTLVRFANNTHNNDWLYVKGFELPYQACYFINITSITLRQQKFVKLLFNLALVLFLAPGFGHAEPNWSAEVLGGATTYHLLGTDAHSASKFSNKLSLDGRFIFTPLTGMSISAETEGLYQSVKVFSGGNSVGEGIAGTGYSFGKKIGNWNSGLAVVLYVQDPYPFAQRQIIPYGARMSDHLSMVPIVGWDVGYQMQVSKQMYIKENNIVSPFMFNSYLSLGWDLL